MNLLSSIFTPVNIKSKIIEKLKPFSQLQREYGFESIYRTGSIEYYSEKGKNSTTFKLGGVPLARTTSRPTLDDNEEGKMDILEPVWYATSLDHSINYCNKEHDAYERSKIIWETYFKEPFRDKPPSPCESYRYQPHDESSYRGKRLLFLDLTGKKSDSDNSYKMDTDFVSMIYDNIMKKYEDQMWEDEGKKLLCVDHPCDNIFSELEIRSAYGSYGGIRISELYIDRFFTLELFHIVKELGIEKKLNCIFMGYFHGTVEAGTFHGEEKKIVHDGYMPAEFSIPYRSAIVKNYIGFKGLVAKGRKLVSDTEETKSDTKDINVKRRRVGGKNTNKKTHKPTKKKSKRKTNKK